MVTRPDAPAGRGRHLEASPVAQLAESAGLEVLKPAKARDPEFLDRLRAIGPDCCPVAAYGALLPQAALDIPPHGWVNLHFSLLPAWRGAAPVQHALLHGDDVTGATTFQIVKELDAGPVFGVLTEPVGPRDTAGDLLGRLAVSGARLLVDTLDGIESGELRRGPAARGGHQLRAQDQPRGRPGRLGGCRRVAIDRLIRGCTPEPGAWTELSGVRLKLGPVELAPAAALDGVGPLAPGELLVGATLRCWPGPAPSRSSWAWCSRRASARSRPPTGAAACTSPAPTLLKLG